MVGDCFESAGTAYDPAQMQREGVAVALEAEESRCSLDEVSCMVPRQMQIAG